MLKLIDLLNYQFQEQSPISYSLIPAIIDWVDYDDEVTFLPFIKRENEVQKVIIIGTLLIRINVKMPLLKH
jgi:hypothetical protein